MLDLNFLNIILQYGCHLKARPFISTCKQVCVSGMLYYTECSKTLNEWKLEKIIFQILCHSLSLTKSP